MAQGSPTAITAGLPNSQSCLKLSHHSCFSAKTVPCQRCSMYRKEYADISRVANSMPASLKMGLPLWKLSLYLLSHAQYIQDTVAHLNNIFTNNANRCVGRLREEWLKQSSKTASQRLQPHIPAISSLRRILSITKVPLRSVQQDRMG